MFGVRMLTSNAWVPTALAAVMVLGAPALAVEPTRLSGILSGRVMDSAGVPQMGAAVLLFNRYDRLIARVLTNDSGIFQFQSLSPDTYSVRVSLPTFVPALRRNIAIQPGMRSFLAISLTSMLSSIELIYVSPRHAPLMSDDWKWVLRSANSTRPVLRVIAGGVDITDPAQKQRRLSNVFSGTRGLFRISSGETEGLNTAGYQADLGTAFALATSLFGSNQLSVSGNVGYASHTGTPTAGFRTSFSRAADGSKPQVNVTMRQIFLPARIGAGLASGGEIPVLRTLDVSFVDRREIAENLHLEYGSSLESVSFLTRLNYVSPFARLRWGDVREGAIEVGFSSGAPATELLGPDEVQQAELQHNLTTLSLFPRVSLREGRAAVQRTQNYEIGYRRSVGSRTVSASVFREAVSNAAFNASAPAGLFGAADLLPDLASRTSVFNAGSFRRLGYTAGLTQHLGQSHNATVAWGFQGTLDVAGRPLLAATPAEVRSSLRTTSRHSVTARLSGAAPGTGTRYVASYQFTDYSVLQPVHLSLTQRTTLEPGLNFYLRQPIPGAGTLVPGRLEATAELRNVLAQGYLPIATPGGHKLLLIQSPKAVRGGLSFIF
jgi:hypothetical protein